MELTEGKNLADLVIYENENYRYSRSSVQVTGGKFELGQVLKKTGSKHTAIDAAAGDNPSGILLNDTDASAGDKEAVILDLEGIVHADALIMDGTAAQKDAVIDKLKTLLKIKVR
ncbi:head decoration protein [Microbulbifer sp. PSTR4-B]|uniref:head decoration protein n=1 Tax=unclassified Microbulbifer TaxID=2619833 RepID=UPI00403B22B7